jgi:hypothetical protein
MRNKKLVGFVLGAATGAALALLVSCSSPGLRSGVDLSRVGTGTSSGMSVGARGEIYSRPLPKSAVFNGLEIGTRIRVGGASAEDSITTPSQGRGGGTVTLDESVEYGQVDGVGVVRMVGDPLTDRGTTRLYSEAFGGAAYRTGTASVLGLSREFSETVPLVGVGLGVEWGSGAFAGLEWRTDLGDVEEIGVVFGFRTGF